MIPKLFRAALNLARRGGRPIAGAALLFALALALSLGLSSFTASNAPGGWGRKR